MRKITPVDPSEMSASEVENRLTQIAYRRLPQSLIMTLVVVVLFVGLFWPFYPARPMTIWFCLLLITVAGRYAHWVLFQRATPDSAAFSKWRRMFVASAAVGGAAWAFGPTLLMPPAGRAESALFVGMLLSVSAVAMNMMASQQAGLRAFLAAALLPPAVAAWRTGGDVEQIVALVLLAGFVSLVLSGHRAGKLIRELLEAELNLLASLKETSAARLESEKLAAAIADRTAELEASQQALNDQIRTLAENRNQLASSQDTLSQLIRSPVLGAGLESAVWYLTEQVAATFHIGRASVWRMADGGQSIQCFSLWDASTKRHSSGLVLSAKEFPAYFKRIKKDTPLIVEQAHTHPATCEFSTTYLAQFDISSLLDVPIHVNGKLWGVMCLEHIGTPRTWAPEHVAFATAAAALIALSIEKSLRWEAERSLLQAKNDAERANAAKSDFLSRMSHEWRTPLNAILGFSRLLASSHNEPGTPHGNGAKLSDEQAENVGEIIKAGEHLLVQVNEILDLSRIEGGHMELSLDAQALAPLVTECVTRMLPVARTRGITVNVAIDAALAVEADSAGLKRVMLALLSNAIKFNREGGQIRINGATNSGQVRLTVSDDGRGIAAENLKRLFRPFERLENSYDGIEGTGIGLALIKALVEAMGGSVGVDSQVGVGSHFWFTLPIGTRAVATSTPTPTQLAPSAQPVTPEIQHRTLLYVEDNLANLKLVRKIISMRPGLTLLDAASAETGLEIARREKPDLILLDINLPGMSGLAALRHLQDHPDTCRIPVLAVTANAMPKDIQQGKDAGFVDYLVKPLNIPLFLKAIDRELAALKPSLEIAKAP